CGAGAGADVTRIPILVWTVRESDARSGITYGLRRPRFMSRGRRILEDRPVHGAEFQHAPSMAPLRPECAMQLVARIQTGISIVPPPDPLQWGLQTSTSGRRACGFARVPRETIGRERHI